MTEKKAANRAEVDACYYLSAFARQLGRIESDIDKRVHMIPGGWRDLKMIRAKLERLIEAMHGTFEDEKAEQIKRMGRCLETRLVFNRSVVREEDMILVDMQELSALIVAASQHCKMEMCEPHKCRKCFLGKTLDKLSWVSRDGRAWWEVFETVTQEE